MSKGYIDKDKVTVYPASNRRDDSRAVYTSEVNITGALKYSNSFESYVIKDPEENGGNLEVILGGYYFKLRDGWQGSSGVISGRDGGDIYLVISTKSESLSTSSPTSPKSIDSAFFNLNNFDSPAKALDVSSNFTGIKLINDADADEKLPWWWKDSKREPGTRGKYKDISDFEPNSGVTTKHVYIYYWLKIGICDGGHFLFDKNALIRYDINHIGSIDENKSIGQYDFHNIITMKKSVFVDKTANPPVLNYPEGKPGDILLVYEDK